MTTAISPKRELSRDTGTEALDSFREGETADETKKAKKDATRASKRLRRRLGIDLEEAVLAEVLPKENAVADNPSPGAAMSSPTRTRTKCSR